MINPSNTCSYTSANGKKYSYCFIPYHHYACPTDNKSVWTIHRDEEFGLFTTSFDLLSGASSTFNLLIDNYEAQPVGKGKAGSSEIKLFLCYFINKSDSENIEWHGYPVNHMDQNRERPSSDFYDVGPGSKLCPRDLKRLKRGKPL